MSEIVPLYPSHLAAHGIPRSFSEVIREKLMDGSMTPGKAVAAFVECRGMERGDACNAVAHLLRSMST